MNATIRNFRNPKDNLEILTDDQRICEFLHGKGIFDWVFAF